MSEPNQKALDDRHFRWRNVAALVAVGALVSGCSGDPGTPSSSWFPSMGGSISGLLNSTPPAGPAMPEGAPKLSADEDCPGVQIRNGAGTLAISSRTEQGSAQDLRYQITFTDSARQCFVVGSTMRIRVGVQGRVIAGPAGAPPQVDVPLRYAVVREGVEPKTITTKFKRFPVTFPQGAGNVLYTDIEEDLSFPMPSPKEIDAYVVYIGFDDQGDRNERRPPAKKNAPRAK